MRLLDWLKYPYFRAKYDLTFREFYEIYNSHQCKETEVDEKKERD